MLELVKKRTSRNVTMSSRSTITSARVVSVSMCIIRCIGRMARVR